MKLTDLLRRITPLAQSKGRSGLLWWFASLFFGPICTLIIVLIEPVKPKTG